MPSSGSMNWLIKSHFIVTDSAPIPIAEHKIQPVSGGAETQHDSLSEVENMVSLIDNEKRGLVELKFKAKE